MTSSRVTVGIFAVAALLLAACDNRAGEPATPTPAADAERAGSRADATRADASREDPRDAVVPQIDGKPMWSANRDRTAEENAEAAFERNGEAFGATSVDDFVRKAHAFTSKPPKGTERIERANGDTLLYDPKANVFAVVTRDGAPRTMFKPDDGPAYWDQQKAREQARSSRGTREEG